MARLTPLGVVNVLLQLLAVCCGVAIVVIVSEKLWVSWSWQGLFYNASGNVCLMTTNSVNFCAYTYVVVALGWISSLVLIAAQCMGGVRACAVAQYFFLFFGLFWWIGAATAATVYGVDADDANWPEKGFRTAVWALGWAEVGLFALTLLLSFCGGPAKEGKAQGDGHPTGAYTQVGGGPPAGAYATSNPTYVAQYPPQAQNPPQGVANV